MVLVREGNAPFDVKRTTSNVDAAKNNMFCERLKIFEII